MDIMNEAYGDTPVPVNRQQHNRWMNESVIAFGVPLTFICPDCYRPPSKCRHTHDPSLVPYLLTKK
jgi:hypothetical protein